MGKSIFEQMGGTYTLGEDGMYYPDLKLPTDEEPRYGKYGRIRKNIFAEASLRAVSGISAEQSVGKRFVKGRLYKKAG